jgi:xanthosine utilization system XapX-like protein
MWRPMLVTFLLALAAGALIGLVACLRLLRDPRPEGV